MATFFVNVNSDHAYSAIMEIVSSKSMTYAKDVVGGNISLELIGTAADYSQLEKVISNINFNSGRIVATIQEGL